MKLRSLAFTAMIAVAFASCSNENDPAPVDNGGGDANGTFLTIKTMNPIATKAVSDNSDAAIKDIAFLVFKGAGTDATLEAIDYRTTGVLTESICFELTAGPKQVVAIANTVTTDKKLGAITLTVDETTVTQVLAQTSTPTAMPVVGTETNLQLSTQIYAVTLLQGTHHLLGFGTAGIPTAEATENYTYTRLLNAADEMKLYRNVAKINLLKFTANMAESPYNNFDMTAKIEVKDIYVLNGSNSTKLVAAAQWGSLFNGGIGRFGITKTEFKDWTATTKESWISTYAAINAADYVGYTPETTYRTQTLPTADNAFSVYAFENNSTTDYTLMVVKALFTYYEGGVYNTTTEEWETIPTEIELDTYYIVPVGYVETGHKFNTTWPTGDSNFNGLRTFGGVMRNLEYNISMTVNGKPGKFDTTEKSDDDTSYMDVQVEVVGYGEATQNVVW